MTRRWIRMLLCGAVMAGCGGSEGGGGSPTANELRDAAREARDQTLRVEVERSGNVPGEGMYGFEGTGLVRNSDASVKGALDGADGPLDAEVRVKGGETWLTVEGTKVAGGKSWVHVEEGRPTVETSIAPHFLLEVFEKARDVERVPGGKVGGAPAEHYRGVVPVRELEDLLYEVGAANRPDERIPLDLYVAGGLPKRLRMQYDYGQGNMFVDIVVLGVAKGAPAGAPPGPTAEYDDLG